MNTILSGKDAELLEQTIAHYGHLVSTDDLKHIFKGKYQDAEIRQQIARLAQRGWLVRIKRGLYVVISDITSLAANNVSLLRISNALNKRSYVSLSSALFYYGLVDQLLQTVTAITNTRTRQYQFQNFTFAFSKVQDDFYFGFSEKRVEGKLVKIADLEKVVLDFLYLRKDAYSLNLIWEILTEHTDEFDFGKLQQFALHSNLTLRRATGFLLDQLDANSDELYDSVKDRNGYSRLTADAKEFNAKWRLYYDHRIIESARTPIAK
ncbi:MAG: type IV toxin-antitoxin system AbiEi family antitoxin domain-containing protein [candidate division KSB1 bacterium]|nr:type IV toxin-antitoxin system AbiEi family antitoxin domain-containing protein [candidate division KSB1 bacterium]MDZ7303244.1 type IV toxin-antitoxin system AbiEi family antitoxin domain-containing protein [candidate division KSB1 bacterium]MDZ7312144.1 type IV toxin-antitoxin system AbiEi family antitoxin domain-containing protein [candidate division KSB1 bacterium]